MGHGRRVRQRTPFVAGRGRDAVVRIGRRRVCSTSSNAGHNAGRDALDSRANRLESSRSPCPCSATSRWSRALRRVRPTRACVVHRRGDDEPCAANPRVAPDVSRIGISRSARSLPARGLDVATHAGARAVPVCDARGHVHRDPPRSSAHRGNDPRHATVRLPAPIDDGVFDGRGTTAHRALAHRGRARGRRELAQPRELRAKRANRSGRVGPRLPRLNIDPSAVPRVRAQRVAATRGARGVRLGPLEAEGLHTRAPRSLAARESERRER